MTPPISALHMLDLLCEQRGWRLQLAATGTKNPDDGPSILTELRAVDRTEPRDTIACVRFDDTCTVEDAARVLLLTIHKAETAL